METEQPPPYVLIERPLVTFAEITAKIEKTATIHDVFRDSLTSFQGFLTVQEDARLLK